MPCSDRRRSDGQRETADLTYVGQCIDVAREVKRQEEKMLYCGRKEAVYWRYDGRKAQSKFLIARLDEMHSLMTNHSEKTCKKVICDSIVVD